MVGTAYRVLPGDRDEVLWRTSGWFSKQVFLSPDGTRLVRVEEDIMYLYENGRLMASRTAESTSLGRKFLISESRSGFSADSQDFHLFTSSGNSEIFALTVEAAAQSELVGLRTIARRVESTVSYDRSVRNYAEVQVNVEGQNRRSRSTVANSVPGKQSASTLISVQSRGDDVRKQGSATVPQQAVPVSVDLPDEHEIYECRVEASLYASATRKKITSTRQIHQSGGSEEMAADRAMAYCEGVVGAGSKTPRGKCDLRECTNLTSGATPSTN